MAAYLGPDSWAWLAQAHDHVRSRHLNALKHETAQDSRGAAVHLRAYRNAGFRIEVMFLAVPAAMSNQGILSRCEPWTPAETADFWRTHRKLQTQLSTQWTVRLDEILEQAKPHREHPSLLQDPD